jgi:WD40 repeat protein
MKKVVYLFGVLFLLSSKIQGASVETLVFSPNSRLFATGLSDGSISLWVDNLIVGNLIPSVVKKSRFISNINMSVSSLAFSPDNTMLAAGYENNSVIIWRVSTATATNVLTNHTAPVTFIQFSPDGTLMQSESSNELLLWNVKNNFSLIALS